MYKVSIVEIQRLWFFLKTLFVSVALIQIARKWKGFVKECVNLDREMVSYGWPKNVQKRIKIALICYWITFTGKVNFFLRT